MADESVEINVSAPGAKEAGRDLAQLKKEAEEMRRVGDFRESTGDQAGAKFARQDAAKIEKEIATAKKEGARADRESAAERRTAAAEERRAQAEAKLTTRGVLRLGAAAGVGALVEAVIADAFERQGITNRGAIRGASDARATGLLGTFRGSAAAAFAAAESGRQEVFEREQKKTELARQTKQGAVNGALTGAAAGAAAGLYFGPQGALIGATAGALAGGVRGYLGGRRAEEENETQQGFARKKVAADEQKQHELFAQTLEQETKARKELVAGHFAEASALRMSQEAFKEYKALQQSGATREQAEESVNVGFEEKRLAIARGLGASAGGRAGNAGLASLAWLGQSFFPKEALDIFHGLKQSVDKADDAARIYDHTRKAR